MPEYYHNGEKRRATWANMPKKLHTVRYEGKGGGNVHFSGKNSSEDAHDHAKRLSPSFGTMSIYERSGVHRRLVSRVRNGIVDRKRP